MRRKYDVNDIAGAVLLSMMTVALIGFLAVVGLAMILSGNEFAMLGGLAVWVFAGVFAVYAGTGVTSMFR